MAEYSSYFHTGAYLCYTRHSLTVNELSCAYLCHEYLRRRRRLEEQSRDMRPVAARVTHPVPGATRNEALALWANATTFDCLIDHCVALLVDTRVEDSDSNLLLCWEVYTTAIRIQFFDPLEEGVELIEERGRSHPGKKTLSICCLDRAISILTGPQVSYWSRRQIAPVSQFPQL